MPRNIKGVLIWMDLEMTGLDPMSDVIVEIATIITDDELNIIAEGPDLVIHQPEEVLSKMNEVVTNMHTESGLLDQITASTLSLDEAGRLTLDFIRALSGSRNRATLWQLDWYRSQISRSLPAQYRELPPLPKC